MGTEILTSFGNLQNELEEAKNSLKGVDESIKRLLGRDPSELPQRNLVKRPLDDKSRTVSKTIGRTRLITENEEPPIKRRGAGSVFKRLSDKVPDDDPPILHKGLISKVIVTPKEIPSREQALEAQNRDEKFKARNKRMFGALLGTLQKFQQEETKLKQREQKRAELEKKIEEHEIKEKEEVRRERQELFFNRKKKQAEIKIIELKMLRMKEYASWEQSQKPRINFIQTKAKPHIHYLPRKMTDHTKNLLQESSKEIVDMIDKKKKQVADELEHIEMRMKKNFGKLGMQKENVTDQEGSHDQHVNDEDHVDENEIDNSINSNTDVQEKKVQPELVNTELSSIQLPVDKETNSISEVNTREESNIDNVVKNSTSQSEYYEESQSKDPDNFKNHGSQSDLVPSE
ncbi:pinin [Diorhabda sublineata]|uniref:pinin n=1 Tax=Diorhabda sublineata TaxID=1163346 RepID=UPI0024E10024|nr:pinin [Diorhabda sublineata]